MNNFYRYNQPHLPPNSTGNFNNNYCYKYCSNKKYPTRSTLSNKSNINFCSLKENTCQSLNDVENFLCNFSSFIKYIKLYCLLK